MAEVKMKKTCFLSLIMTLILLFSMIAVASADVDGIFEMWRSKEGTIKLISIYNEDCTECRGQSYEQQICQLAEGGCTCCGICYSDSCGGGGADPIATIEEKYWQTHVYFVISSPVDTNDHNVMGLIFDTGDGTLTQSSTPENFIVNGVYVPVTDEYITDETLNNIQVGGTFNERTLIDEGSFSGICTQHSRIRNWHTETVTYTLNIPISTTSERNEGTIYVNREDNYNGDPHTTRWNIGDHPESVLVMESFSETGAHGQNYDRWFMTSVTGDWNDLVVEGQEREHTKTIQVTIPSGGGGLPTLEPKNYGVQILGTLYGPQSLDEIPPELLNYTKEINGQLYTYDNSKLDLWIYENIYKPNHDKSYNN